MGFLGGITKGIGRAIKGVTKPLFGNSILDEIGTVGGFALGGPMGAAAGRGLGKGLATGNIGEGLKGAAEGFALGTGAGALGLKGGSMALPKLGGIGRLIGGGGVPGLGGAPAGGGGYSPFPMDGAMPTGGVNTAAPSLGSLIGRIGGGAGDALNWLTANPQRTQLGLGVLGGALNTYGASREAGAANRAYGDERGDVDYQRRRNEQYDPLRMRLLERLAGPGGG